eukprot:15198180-Ditylum_brightwellii.AAC.1
MQSTDVQQKKKYYSESSPVGSNRIMLSHASEVLCQVEGLKLLKGDCVKGSSFFGSVTMAAEIHNKLKVEHKSKGLGHYVVRKTMIARMELLACDYSWSHSYMSYFLSTTGN